MRKIPTSSLMLRFYLYTIGNPLHNRSIPCISGSPTPGATPLGKAKCAIFIEERLAGVGPEICGPPLRQVGETRHIARCYFARQAHRGDAEDNASKISRPRRVVRHDV